MPISRTTHACFAVALLIVTGCGKETVVQSGLTGVEVSVGYDAGLNLDQIVFVGRDINGERIFAPTPRPETPSPIGGGSTSVVILLADELGGQRVVIRADGISQSLVVASAADQVDLVAQQIVAVSLTLGAAVTCGDGAVAALAEACDDGNTDPGDGCDQSCSIEPGWTCDASQPSVCLQCGNDVCDSGENGCTCPEDCPNAPSCFPGQRCQGNTCVCDDLSCPGGCCAGVSCVSSSIGTCGLNGSACNDCSVVGDSCDAAGDCACSGGAACGIGEHCVVGSCICDNVGCAAGCCDGSGCQPPSLSNCGIGGSTCRACNPDRADACLDGVCRCGLGAGCGAGQRCDNGVCICDPTSCPSGCCEGTTCTTPSFDACGNTGVACAPCDPSLADDCSAGSCSCGTGPACSAGQRCLGGTCVCDNTSCPSGCCRAGVCETASSATCGTGGSACRDCGIGADTCDGVTCQCGATAACAPGQACVGGACVCNATSCASGCCNGTDCIAATLATCGTLGGTCSACDPAKADSCVDGNCQCGSNAPCGAGESCQSGVCVSGCDVSNCGSGCCSGTTCAAPSSFGACGEGGVACVACDAGRADDCIGGVCTCGGSAACAPGQECSGGACVCTGSSCPSGCCNGDLCEVDALSACGSGGNLCIDCGDAADACVAGGCACGSGGACAAGQRCDAGACICDGSSCPSGCCDGDVCTTPTIDSCGSSGNPCVACDLTRADDCVGGACQCGSASACSLGSACSSGSCACDPGSCSGCCDASGCHAPSFLTCGSGGVACVACDATVADDCTGGVCTCGGAAACGVDEACSAGACVPTCNPTTCANGCCSGATCIDPVDAANCGAAGAACTTCNALNADGCTNGVCTCGGLAACTGGETCQSGLCAPPACDLTTCANGCCDTVGACRAGNHKFWCGDAAAACTDCNDLGLSCVNQSCQ